MMVALRCWFAFLLVLISGVGDASAAIPDEPPAPIELTPAEVSELGSRDVVVRIDNTDTGGGVTGVIDVRASVDAVWTSLMDFKARVSEIGSLKDVSYYDQSSAKLGAQWRLGVLGTTVIFHSVYKLHPDQGWVRYALDTSRENDIVALQGAYQLYTVDGGSRLIYRTQTDSGRRVPAFIRNLLTTGSLVDQLSGVRDRAESL